MHRTDRGTQAIPAEAKEWLKHYKPIPYEEVLAGFGFTMNDFRKMGETPLPPESSHRPEVYR